MTGRQTFLVRIVPVPPRSDIPELLDEPASVLPDLRDNLRDLRRLNRWFGGTAIALNALARHLRGRASVTMLDVATGTADIPLAAYRWANRRGIRLDITASDVSPEVLAEAERHLGRSPVCLRLADARRLPWPDDSFDVVTCSLALHHFGPAEARTVLAEMARVSRSTVITVDLVRSYPAFILTWLLMRMITRNRLTRSDGPRSVLRAYRPNELHSLALGIPDVRIKYKRHAFFRQSLLLHKVASHA